MIISLSQMPQDILLNSLQAKSHIRDEKRVVAKGMKDFVSLIPIMQQLFILVFITNNLFC